MVKRVLVVLRILWTAGAQRIAINEYRWLKRLGYDPKLVFLRGTETKGYEEMLGGVDYEVIRWGNGPLTPLFYAGMKVFAPDRGMESTVDLDLIAKIPQIAKREGADYLVCHDQFAGIGGLRAKKELGIPYSVFIHEKVVEHRTPLLGGLVDGWERGVVTGAEKVFAVTEKVAETLREKHGIAAEVNYPGMDRISSPPRSARQNYLIAVSFWDYGRRPEDYLRVIEAVGGYKLLIVGNWRVKGAEEAFSRKIKEMKLEERVDVMKGVPENRLSQLYDQSAFLLRFGYGEYGLATAVIEAIQHTLPVIINDELGTSDLIRESGGGLVVKGVDPKAISEFLERMDDGEYAKLQGGLGQLQKKYSWENHAKKLVEPLERPGSPPNSSSPARGKRGCSGDMRTGSRAPFQRVQDARNLERLRNCFSMPAEEIVMKLNRRFHTFGHSLSVLLA